MRAEGPRPASQRSACAAHQDALAAPRTFNTSGPIARVSAPDDSWRAGRPWPCARASFPQEVRAHLAQAPTRASQIIGCSWSIQQQGSNHDTKALWLPKLTNTPKSPFITPSAIYPSPIGSPTDSADEAYFPHLRKFAIIRPSPSPDLALNPAGGLHDDFGDIHGRRASASSHPRRPGNRPLVADIAGVG